jgi:hypothetical protein
MPPDPNNAPPILRAKLPPSSEDWRGYVCIWRKLRDHPRYRDSEFFHVWVHLILNATHKKIEAIFCGKKIVLQPGQLITGRHAISRDTGVNDSKVYRILEQLKSEQQIEQQGKNLSSLITITNWRVYQFSEQQIEQPSNNERTTNEQPSNTNNNEKNLKTKKRGASPTTAALKLNGAEIVLRERELERVRKEFNSLCSISSQTWREDFGEQAKGLANRERELMEMLGLTL